MFVPFNDLSRIHKPIIKSVLEKFNVVVQNNDFILNDDIKLFEQNFSKYTKQNFTVSCTNGTDALELILRGLKIGSGDEVIVPVNTFIATSLAVDNVGAKTVFVDNDDFYLMDINQLKSKISKKTKAIIGVNLYGQMCDVSNILSICKENNLYFIEDAAQSHGATQGTTTVGKFSIASAYSFYPGKNLGAWGDGGAVTTNSKSLYKKILKLRNFGSIEKYKHELIGVNSKLQPLQGIVLNEKLKYLDDWNEERINIAKIYLEKLYENKNINLPKIYKDNKHVWHLFVIQVKNRKRFIEFCQDNGVETGIHYPLPVIKQLAYKNHNQANEIFKNSFTQYKKLVSLPIFPKMKKKEINYVIEVLNKYEK